MTKHRQEQYSKMLIFLFIIILLYNWMGSTMLTNFHLLYCAGSQFYYKSFIVSVSVWKTTETRWGIIHHNLGISFRLTILQYISVAYKCLGWVVYANIKLRSRVHGVFDALVMWCVHWRVCMLCKSTMILAEVAFGYDYMRWLPSGSCMTDHILVALKDSSHMAICLYELRVKYKKIMLRKCSKSHYHHHHQYERSLIPINRMPWPICIECESLTMWDTLEIQSSWWCQLDGNTISWSAPPSQQLIMA